MILDGIYLIQIIITLIFSIVFCFYDIKKGFLPNRLNYILTAFGFASNLILTIITSNIKFIFFSIISYSITYIITLMLWQLNIWGGGDVKLFSSIAAVIPFGINISFLNNSPLLSFYPFSFTVMLNSILVSFPFLILLLIYLINKNNVFDENIEVFKGFFNYKSLKLLMDSSFNKHINVADLKEGMMINNFYFDNYFKTLTAGGITKDDMYLLKIMNAQKIISNQISIKLGFPYVPAILVGLVIAIFYGDLSMLILKNIIFVI